MTEKERIALGIDTLPLTLGDAIKELSKNKVVQSALGEHIYDRYMEAKTIEWSRYRTQVHKWELEQYLTVF
jgi:glutamine synthetase